MADSVHTFHLTVASVGTTYFDGTARSVSVPSDAGKITLLPHHEAFITTLKQGTIEVMSQDNEVTKIEVESGVLECADNRIVILL